MYIVTTENIEDGMWFDDPEGFDTEKEAREFVTKKGDAPSGNCFAIYECHLIASIGDDRT